MKLKLGVQPDRSVLGEGRNYGLGFAFAERKGDTLDLVQPISPCKDYLNDVVYSEVTGKPYKAWGLVTAKRGIFKDEALLVIAVCKQGPRQGVEYPAYKADLKALDDNHTQIQKLINWFESKIKLKTLTKIAPLCPGKYLLSLPLWWVEATYRVSLVSLLARLGMYWDGKGDEWEFMGSVKTADKYYLPPAIEKMKKMIKGNIPTQDFSQEFNVHNCGIVDYKFT